jgi:hypothetical protein
MTLGVLIKPSNISTDDIYGLIDLMGKSIMADDSIQNITISEDNYLKEIIPLLNFEEGLIGDTDTIFYDQNSVYKMIYCSNKNFSRNIFGSIFHPEGIVIYGNVVIIKMDNDSKIIDCIKEEIVKLMINRREHKGIYLKNGIYVKDIIIDNRWNIKDHDISNYKKQIITIYNYHIIMISKNNCILLDNEEKYIFALLDDKRKVIVDFSEGEFEMLKKISEIPELIIESFDNPKNPYVILKQAFSNLN